ncbi:mCG140668, partial [Mus musculus]
TLKNSHTFNLGQKSKS